jgi:hypothetical protein
MLGGIQDSQDKSNFWEADSCSLGQEIPRLLWNPKLHYRVHMSPPLDPILSHLNPLHNLMPIYVRSVLIVSSHLRQILSSSFFRSGFPTEVL